MSSTQRTLPGNTRDPQETDIHVRVTPASEWPQTRLLDRVATGIICLAFWYNEDKVLQTDYSGRGLNRA